MALHNVIASKLVTTNKVSKNNKSKGFAFREFVGENKENVLASFASE